MLTLLTRYLIFTQTKVFEDKLQEQIVVIQLNNERLQNILEKIKRKIAVHSAKLRHIQIKQHDCAEDI